LTENIKSKVKELGAFARVLTLLLEIFQSQWIKHVHIDDRVPR